MVYMSVPVEIRVTLKFKLLSRFFMKYLAKSVRSANLLAKQFLWAR